MSFQGLLTLQMAILATLPDSLGPGAGRGTWAGSLAFTEGGGSWPFQSSRKGSQPGTRAFFFRGWHRILTDKGGGTFGTGQCTQGSHKGLFPNCRWVSQSELTEDTAAAFPSAPFLFPFHWWEASAPGSSQQAVEEATRHQHTG